MQRCKKERKILIDKGWKLLGEKAKTIYFHNLWLDKKFVSDLSVGVEEQGGNVYKVKINAKSFARAVFVDYPCSEGVTYSDNFFDLDFGEEKTVIIKSEKQLDVSKITVKTYADTWVD